MPYIAQADKDRLAAGEQPTKTGELTYLITMALLNSGPPLPSAGDSIRAAIDRFLDGHEPSFSLFAQVLGALSAAGFEHSRRLGTGEAFMDRLLLADIALEFYDTAVAPYEDTKIQENGDVY